MARPARLALLLALGLAACGQTPSTPSAGNDAQPSSADQPASPVAPSTPTADAAPPPGSLVSCESQIGAVEARALADQCRAVSPATRPPCNAANSCALIREEIARSCSLFGPDAAGTPGCGKSPFSADAAADVVRRYYEAIAARDYATAYSQWGDDGKHSGQTYEAFAAGFARTRSVTATVGTPGAIEGAAGSLYVTVPVTLDAVQDDGTRQTFSGDYVIRRVNDVPGATADQRRWRIGSASLRTVK